MVKIYKGYAIESDFYSMGDFTVQYCGDDILFDSLDDAKEFIDEITEGDVKE